jgi:hypothetical protein
MDKMVLEKGEVYWLPGSEDDVFDPNIDIYLMEGFTVSEGHWQEWLDQTMTEAANEGDPYVLVLIDTLMNVAGDVEENKSQSMTTKIFKPMKVLMRKHDCSMRFVHHMGKGGEERRGGARMLGGTANHAWAEDSLYLTRDGKSGHLKMEFESKSAPEQFYTITGLDNKMWTPLFEPTKPKDAPTQAKRTRTKPAQTGGSHPLIDLLAQGGNWTTNDIADALDRPYHSVYKTLNRMAEKKVLVKVGKGLWRTK